MIRQGSRKATFSPTHKHTVLVRNREGSTVEQQYHVADEILGEGAFGSVRRVTRIKTGNKDCIMKTMKKAVIPDMNSLSNEISIQAGLDHPNICRIHEVFYMADQIDLIMEACCGGDLSDAICEASQFCEHDAQHVMHQVVRAVCYMHSKGIAHRDMKPENLLLKEKGVPFTKNNVKVVDFGFAQSFEPGKKTLLTKCGTPHFLAPEILYQETYDEKCDVWSCGIILYMFLSGVPPFDGQTDMEIFEKAAAGKSKFEGEIWAKVAPTAKLAIVQMCKVDPNLRFSAEATLLSPWMRQELPKLDTLGDGLCSFDILEGMRNFKRMNRFKKAASYLVARNLPESSQLRKMRQAFEALDRNGDGMLNMEELKSGVGENAICSKLIEEVFTALDKDHAGQVEWTEFLAAVADQKLLGSSQLLFTESACWEAFRVLDSDSDSKLSVEEIKEWLTQEDCKVDEGEVQAVLMEADLDGDGYVCFEEFLSMMQGWTASKKWVGGSEPCLYQSAVSLLRQVSR